MYPSPGGPETVRILHVEDDRPFAELTVRSLEEQDDRFAVESVRDAEAGLDRLAEGGIDCVVSDYEMPGRDGIEFLRAVREERPDLPFILFTGRGSEAVASEAISAGVTDYLQKESGTSQFEVLANRIDNAVEQHRARRDLERKETLLDSIFDQIPAHLFVKDEAGRHLRVSTHFLDGGLENTDDLLVEAYDREHVLGRSDVELFDSEQARESHADDMRVIETGEPIRNEVEAVPNEDEWLLTSKVPWRDADGEIRGVIGITQRITEQKRTELELERTTERLDRLASVLDHDLRTPLTVAVDGVEVARQDCDHEALDEAATALDRIEDLTEDVVTLARQDERVTDPEPVDLAAVADRCRDSVRAGSARVEARTDATVRADPDRLQRLVETLAWNIVEHGSTSPRSSSTPEDAVEHGSTSPDSQARQDAVEHGSKTDDAAPDPVTVTIGDHEDGFYVADDGTGVPGGERDAAFEDGDATPEDGTGFGIAEEIARAHGWDLAVTEATDGGTRFEVRGVDRVD